MNRRLKAFVSVGHALVKAIVPGVAEAEAAFASLPGKHGAAKLEAVEEIAVASVLAAEGISGQDYVNDPEFREGMANVREGLVKILHAAHRLEPSV